MKVFDDESPPAEIDPAVYARQNTLLNRASALVYADFEWDWQAIARIENGRCQLGIGTNTVDRRTFQLMGEGETWAEALRAAGVPVGNTAEAKRRNGVTRVEPDGLVRVMVPPKSTAKGRAFQRALEATPNKPEGWRSLSNCGVRLRLKVGGALLELFERIMKEIEA